MAVSVDVPEGLEKEMEEEVRKGRYKSKSELMRDAIRRLLEKQRVDEKISVEMQERLDEARESGKVSHSKAKKELQK
jgi:putative addiction module CopG family antidote